MRYLWVVVSIALIVINHLLRRGTDEMIDDFIEESRKDTSRK